MFNARKKYFWVGIIGSIIWLVAGIAVIAFNWKQGLDPNQWGDVFAGLAAPMAFLWLVLGFLQQGDELRLSSRALELQAEELKNSVEQQKQLVAAAQKQVETTKQQMAEALAASTKATETLVSTERPYVTVGGDYKKNSDQSIFEDAAGNRFFRLEVGNYGKTPAILTAFDVRFDTLEKVQTTPNDVRPCNPHHDLLAPTEKHKVLRDDLKITAGSKVVYGAFWYRSPLGGGDLISCFAHLLGDTGAEVHVPGVHDSYRKRD
jgi:hypothetical protein